MSDSNYEIRSYREQFNKERFVGFTALFRETDLWIGINPEALNSAGKNFPDYTGRDSTIEKMKNLSVEKIEELRRKLERYILAEPQFGKSLQPFRPSKFAPPEAAEMAAAAAKAGIGPMASVAGLFAREVGRTLLQNFSIQELVIENGGDIFAVIKKELVLSVFAGDSPLSGKIGLVIPPATGQIGFCTSSGTIGPSLSFGNADAVVAVSRDVLLSDAFATALCNEVKTPDDMENVLENSKDHPEILSVVIICKDKIGVQGEFEIRMLK
ncbi:MAG: UPF0280 family protein [Prolixibacteraceae bacterium]|jgi:ApbE superfamily uncharacterized protein (UPF0280 family)|nr:UPF0280 family protein [Prolixibacteraceae bacterium]NLO02989.1 UPF0280 family protein [Bacteroidales bacterium]